MGYSDIPKDIVRNYGLVKCNCVITARKLNPDLPYGLFSVKQKNRIINSQIPEIGATVFTREGGWTGHAATVIGTDGDTITILEANYKSCRVTVRQLKITDTKIIGYYI